ncbi:hypothetical protein QBC44DRAFT_340839 [Cladorrhinum sp. PSN332]|nr:hypothetical protein QBC44DRAFT_340839 [Cladorrhinum sp. PSN332]
MLIPELGLVLCFCAALVTAWQKPHDNNVVVRTRNLPGTTDEDTFQLLHRRLVDFAMNNRDVTLRNSSTIGKSWNGATLYNRVFEPAKSSPSNALQANASIDITCVTCYFKAGATVELSVKGDFNISSTIKDVTNQVQVGLANVTGSVMTSFDQYFDHIKNEFTSNQLDPSDFSFDNFSIDTDFDINIPPIGGVELLFQLDELELYMLVSTKLQAQSTLTIPLYRSQTPFGFGVDGMELGVFITADLTLAARGSFEATSGFHLKVNPPLGFKITMFASELAEVIFSGAQFEFLPVTIQAANVVLEGVLRIGMHAGFELLTSPLPLFGKLVTGLSDASAGVEVGVYGNVAQFVTNVTAGDEFAKDNKGCALRARQEYTFAMAAVASATMEIGTDSWGPDPTLTVPMFYTTLADVCVPTVAPPAIITSPIFTKRQAATGLTTTTLTTTVTHTGIVCATATFPCPVTLQTTSVSKETKTLVTSVPSGQQATFPPSTTEEPVTATIPFGAGAKSIGATTGVPQSFVPPTPATDLSSQISGFADGAGSKAKNFLDGNTNGVSNKVIMGVSFGIALPVLIVLIVLVVCLCKRRKKKKKYQSVPARAVEPPQIVVIDTGD